MKRGTQHSRPTDLRVELLAEPAMAVVTDPVPEFSWVVNSPEQGDVQIAYRILVASTGEALEQGIAELWDSGQVEAASSVAVPYAGKPLLAGESCAWQVKTWCARAGESEWSRPQSFRMADELDATVVSRYPVVTSEIEPCEVRQLEGGRYLADFGRVAFGYLQLTMAGVGEAGTVTVHFGERGSPTGLNREPGGSVRYYRVDQALFPGTRCYEIHPPQDERNTGPRAIPIPTSIGVIAPFRYVEFEGLLDPLTADMLRQVAVHYPFDEEASRFDSSDPVLNDVWALCKYSMKATSFAGIYVDGDRERIPYEGDAYLNQLSHYAVDREYTLARHSHEYLLDHPTWPTEWKLHSVLMAWTDYTYTGSLKSLERTYGVLKQEKTLEFMAREDGLLNTKGSRDIIDWPRVERDGYEKGDVNTVTNAFYCRVLACMADLAEALGHAEDAEDYRQRSAAVRDVFNKVFYDPARGLYRDGSESSHVSLHANMMPLAFGLVQPEAVEHVADYLESRGMACSVYGAQYLLEALYRAGRPAAALALMNSKALRSWYHMLRLGSTITLEAWDNRFKANNDWNHAWGAAPGNIIARYVMGVRPLTPGFGRVLIQPSPGPLERASARIPTVRGSIELDFTRPDGRHFLLNLAVPANMRAVVTLPSDGPDSTTVTLDGSPVRTRSRNGRLGIMDEVGSGRHEMVQVWA